MTRLLAILLLLPAIASAAGLGVYNPAQHAVNGFMPTQLPDLQLWLDANKIGLTNGASVDVWQDFSGKSNWATNGTVSKRPTVLSINSRPALSFDGTDDWLAISGYKSQTFVAVFIVCHYAGTGERFFVEHGPDVNTTDGFYFYGGSNPWGFRRNSGVHFANSANWVTETTPVVVAMTYDGTGYHYKNGTKLASSITGTSRANSLTTNTLNIGSRNGASLFLNAKVAEIIATTNKATDETISQVSRYLGTKYGIVVQ